MIRKNIFNRLKSLCKSAISLLSQSTICSILFFFNSNFFIGFNSVAVKLCALLEFRWGNYLRILQVDQIKNYTYISAFNVLLLQYKYNYINSKLYCKDFGLNSGNKEQFTLITQRKKSEDCFKATDNKQLCAVASISVPGCFSLS